MRRRIAVTFAVLLVAGMFPLSTAYAQQAQRMIITRIIPRYPDLARPMHLEGTVKVSVQVAPNGTVKAVRPVGGSPLLLKAAQEAITQWKWVPASQESNELIELHFKPE